MGEAHDHLMTHAHKNHARASGVKATSDDLTFGAQFSTGQSIRFTWGKGMSQLDDNPLPRKPNR